MNNITISVGQASFYLWDIIALVWLIAAWSAYSLYTRHESRNRRNIIDVMQGYRLQWMQRMLARENRMVDATIIGNLLRSIAFFASTSVFIIAGILSLLDYQDAAREVLAVIPITAENNGTNHSWELKVLVLTIIFIQAFFKYTWSLRQYNYASIIVGAAPTPSENKKEAERYAHRAAMLTSNAGHHFNLGLRAYYFGLATLSWFIHPIIFMIATTLVLLVLYRREFRSRALDLLLDEDNQ